MPDRPSQELPPSDPVGEHVYRSFREAGLSGEGAHTALEGVRRNAGKSVIDMIHEMRVEQCAEQRERRAERLAWRAELHAEQRDWRAELRAGQRKQRAELQKLAVTQSAETQKLAAAQVAETQELAATQSAEMQALLAEIHSLYWMSWGVLVMLAFLGSATVWVGIGLLLERPAVPPSVVERPTAPDPASAEAGSAAVEHLRVRVSS